MFESWNGWSPKDGDYEAKYDTPKQSTLLLVISSKVVVNTTYAVLSLSVFAIILNLIMKV
ncbi:MAG: hypothetical protein KKF62_14825 [Bacteroidetes bacterium]|nr:hypothetical protein [Bacteroidota bacterium]MBU1113662.1 hypothetical protein [Bacteroidota bacterium]MBU1796752.1 hypothetical protein [Bacteroidota bacterium]